MARKTFFISTSIPYVNAAPHLGHALEFMQADIIARYRRLLGDDVFFLTGTDENALKNVQAAEEAGKPVAEFVDGQAEAFKKLAEQLAISNDDFIRTAKDERHIKGAQKFWSALNPDDIDKRNYSGLYCVGCEEFKTEKDLVNGECIEHPGRKLEFVEEENWFFKLTNYQDDLYKIISTGEVEIIPESRKNETLRFIESGLEDISISRSNERARNWGVPVPGDSTQRMFVWVDALSNYITALGYATDSEEFQRYWAEGDEVVHVIGKGINRFHTVYWLALLISAGVRLPTKVFIHGYITVDGQKMSKSLGNVIDPVEIVNEYGTDALRYYLARHVHPFEDSDFTMERFKETYNANLANGLGNLVARVMKMAENYLNESVKVDSVGYRYSAYVKELMSQFRIDLVMDYAWAKIGELDREIQEKKPWESKEKEVVKSLVLNLYRIGCLLRPFIPETAEAIIETTRNNKMPGTLFPRKE